MKKKEREDRDRQRSRDIDQLLDVVRANRRPLFVESDRELLDYLTDYCKDAWVLGYESHRRATARAQRARRKGGENV